MPRNEIDWSILDETLGGLPPPAVQFEQDVANARKAMESVIDGAITKKSKIGHQIVSLASNIEGSEGYISDYARHAALYEVLGEHGVLDGYYIADPTRTKDVLTPDGWIVTLRSPKTNGSFRVTSRTEGRKNDVAQKGKNIERLTVTYKHKH